MMANEGMTLQLKKILQAAQVLLQFYILVSMVTTPCISKAKSVIIDQSNQRGSPLNAKSA